jgi:NADPH-ferrihemoprotein reductase
MNSFNNFAPELDDVLLVCLLAILFSLWTSHGILWSKPQKGHQLYFVSPQLEEPGFQTIGRGPRQPITRQINDRMTELRKGIIVFWGSQSGNAERLANSFVRDCVVRFNLPAMAANLDLYDYGQLGEISEGRLVGFVLTTYGEGNPTDNATGLYEYLRRVGKSRGTPLSRLQYFCFGLGNSKYQFYNSFVDYVDKTLSLCGAQRIAPAGKIDEAQRSDADWLSWKDEMLMILASQ